jgi:hypothetical protein
MGVEGVVLWQARRRRRMRKAVGRENWVRRPGRRAAWVRRTGMKRWFMLR